MFIVFELNSCGVQWLLVVFPYLLQGRFKTWTGQQLLHSEAKTIKVVVEVFRPASSVRTGGMSLKPEHQIDFSLTFFLQIEV